MSIQYTYTTLTDAIKGYAEDNDSEFVAQIPDFIGKAESRVLRDLDLELFEQWVEVTISGADRLVTKPTDAIEINDLWVRNPSTLKWTECSRRSFEYCLSYAPTESALGMPAFFSEYDESQVYVVPTPDISYSNGNARVRATIRPTGLTSQNATTWLGDNMGDLLYQGCMMEAYEYLKHPQGVQAAAQKYQSLIPALSREIEDVVRKRYKGLNKQKEGADD